MAPMIGTVAWCGINAAEVVQRDGIIEESNENFLQATIEPKIIVRAARTFTEVFSRELRAPLTEDDGKRIYDNQGKRQGSIGGEKSNNMARDNGDS